MQSLYSRGPGRTVKSCMRLPLYKWTVASFPQCCMWLNPSQCRSASHPQPQQTKTRKIQMYLQNGTMHSLFSCRDAVRENNCTFPEYFSMVIMWLTFHHKYTNEAMYNLWPVSGSLCKCMLVLCFTGGQGRKLKAAMYQESSSNHLSDGSIFCTFWITLWTSLWTRPCVYMYVCVLLYSPSGSSLNGFSHFAALLFWLYSSKPSF